MNLVQCSCSWLGDTPLYTYSYTCGGHVQCWAFLFACLQAKAKAKKDLEKARKVREPLTKKLAEEPAALDTLAAEMAELTKQLEAMQ